MQQEMWRRMQGLQRWIALAITAVRAALTVWLDATERALVRLPQLWRDLTLDATQRMRPLAHGLTQGLMRRIHDLPGQMRDLPGQARDLARGAFAVAAARQRTIVLVLLFTCVALLPGLALAGSGGSAAAFVDRRTAPVVRTKPLASNLSEAIRSENNQPGATDWLVPPERAATNEIQAYADASSVAPGGSIGFYVSVQQAGSPYSIDIYRLGWYGGAGAHLLVTQQRTGQAQGYWDEDKGKLVGCGSCHVDRSTGLAEADWQPSYQLAIPSDWLTGVYLAKFTAASGKATTVTFDVRGAPHSTYVVVTTDTTVQAYSDWGGASLYLARYRLPGAHASKVSFDRPVAGWGTVQGLLYEIDGVRWLEENDYDVSYISSVDLHEHPEQLLGHRALLDFGHDEYWSKEMRDGVEHARDAGIGLAFVGANTAYWQIRFESDSHGVADRTIVCYKSALRDPYFWGGDHTRLTVQWRDPWLGRPENALLGEMYSDWTSPPRGFPWHFTTTAHVSQNDTLLDGTQLQSGQNYGCDLVGYEWDKVFHNGYAPSDLQVLSVSQAASVGGKRDYSNTTYYVARSGALVFDAGSIKWDFALDNLRLQPDRWCTTQHAPVPGMQKLLANVLAAVIVRQMP
jgi:hypothetical protein